MNIVGYTITLNKKTLGEFIDDFRKKAKRIAIEEMQKLVAEDVAKLYDAKFLNGAEYNMSIVDLAVNRVKDNIGRVYMGQARDEKYNLFCNLYVYESRNEQVAVDYYAVLDCANQRIRQAFEDYKEVDDYTYYDFNAKCKPDENERRKQYWLNLLEDCDYDWTGAGYSAKIIDSAAIKNCDRFSVPVLKKHFPTEKKRLTDYLNQTIVADLVTGYIGNVPIDKIDKLSLVGLFERAFNELETDYGKQLYRDLEKKKKAGIQVIDEAIISFNPCIEGDAI